MTTAQYREVREPLVFDAKGNITEGKGTMMLRSTREKR